MLVLSRKIMQSVHLIDKETGKTLAKVQLVGTGKMTRLGFEAEDSVIILREELVDKKEGESSPAVPGRGGEPVLEVA